MEDFTKSLGEFAKNSIRWASWGSRRDVMRAHGRSEEQLRSKQLKMGSARAGQRHSPAELPQTAPDDSLLPTNAPCRLVNKCQKPDRVSSGRGCPRLDCPVLAVGCL